MTRTVAAILAVMLCVSGCAVNGRLLKPDLTDGSNADLAATLIVMRESSVLGIAVNALVKVDGQYIGEIGSGTFIQVRVPTGAHFVTISHGPLPQNTGRADFVAEPKGRYIVHWTTTSPGSADLLNAEVAQATLQGGAYTELKPASPEQQARQEASAVCSAERRTEKQKSRPVGQSFNDALGLAASEAGASAVMAVMGIETVDQTEFRKCMERHGF